ncbi:hypothetical protein QIS99_16445 [Streptomyces sp. B-S-A8]|uniref:Anti-sigma factor n=1 Tax=Streptomyces solicavernae TaxID=3043614 RepID=A0ABT6RTL6_9ACTN|nr:hypothetical protein [Streptomyces sp. B-S-A8]MDI3387778.1 hypothetical protein [Streptomyces sp. B-S-A8]
MTHIDTDALVALALGEPTDAPQRHHLAGCVVCADHLAALVRVVEAAGSSSPADIPQPPPGRLWQAVEEAVRRDDASGARPDRE